MTKSFLVILFSIYVSSFYSQICQNPSYRLESLRTKNITKDTILRLIKNDLDFIDPLLNDTIADIGSRDGYYPLNYSIFFDSTMYYLNDINEDNFVYFDSIKDICTQFKGKNISCKFKIVIGNDSCTNLPNNLFNKVLIRDALHHFKSMDRMLTEIKHIMKFNAKLILYEPIRSTLVINKNLCKGAMTKDELINLLKKNGFNLIRERIQNSYGSWF